MTKEKRFENEIKSWLKEHDCWYVKYFANRNTQAGIPDILACVNGRFVGIEVKSEEGKASELQKHQMKKIREAGGTAFIVKPSDFEGLKIILTAMIKRDKYSD